MFEIEKKFPVNDLQHIERLVLQRFGGDLLPQIRQSDLYLIHPQRDFRQTDEALRIRSVEMEEGNAQVLVTYKGPRRVSAEGQAACKTRREIEVLVSGERPAAAALREIFEALGFRTARKVIKTRQRIASRLGEWPVEFALDTVEGLGEFLEIETQADEARIEAAQEALAEISRELGLSDSTTTSYLNMLMAKED